MYGDIDNVTKDVKALNDILNRQGNTLLLHVISEQVGNLNLKYNWTEKDVQNIITNLCNELKESILERT